MPLVDHATTHVVMPRPFDPMPAPLAFRHFGEPQALAAAWHTSLQAAPVSCCTDSNPNYVLDLALQSR